MQTTQNNPTVHVLSSGGTSRNKYFAEALHRAGLLGKLFILFYLPSYRFLYRWRYGMWPTGIDAQHVRSFPVLYAFYHFLKHGTKNKSVNLWIFTQTAKIFDYFCAKELPAGKAILFAESYVSLATIRQAKRLGMITVLDRTNSHIEFQSSTMNAEYRKYGIGENFLPPSFIKRSLAEYDEVDYIITLSSFVRKTFVDRGFSSDRVFVVPPGTNLSRFTKKTKEDDVFRIIFCGSISIKKGVHYLIEALSGLGQYTFEVWLIGKEEKDISHLYPRGYPAFCKKTGFVPNNKMAWYYSQGSVFVLPSLEEGFPKVILEAMACGLPVVATENTGARDIVRDSVDGFIVPAADAAALREKIVFLLEHEQRRKEMAQSAFEQVHASGSSEDYMKRIMKVLNTLK